MPVTSYHVLGARTVLSPSRIRVQRKLEKTSHATPGKILYCTNSFDLGPNLSRSRTFPATFFVALGYVLYVQIK